MKDSWMGMDVLQWLMPGLERISEAALATHCMNRGSNMLFCRREQAEDQADARLFRNMRFEARHP